MFTFSNFDFNKRVRPFFTRLIGWSIFLITIATFALFWSDNRNVFGVIFLFGLLTSTFLDSLIVDIKVAIDYWKSSFKSENIKILEIKDAILYRSRPNKCLNKLTVEILTTGKTTKMYMYLSDREANDLVYFYGSNNTYRAIFMETSKAIIKLQKLKGNG